MVLRLLEGGYQKYKNDNAYLRETLLTQEHDSSNLLSNLMVRFADNDLLQRIAKKILSDEEYGELLLDERKKIAIETKTPKSNAQEKNSSDKLEEDQTSTAVQGTRPLAIIHSANNAPTSDSKQNATVKGEREKDSTISNQNNRKPIL